jgi:transcription elongation factor Elf1
VKSLLIVHFVIKRSLRKVVLTHMKEFTLEKGRLFVCLFCNNAFTVKSSLDEHKRIHTVEKLYICLSCSGVVRVSGAQGNDENWRPPEGDKRLRQASLASCA